MNQAINNIQDYQKRVELYKADQKRLMFFQQMIKISELAPAPKAIFDPIRSQMTWELPEPSKSQVDELKKALLVYDLNTYPDLLIKDNWSADGDLFSFEFRKDDQTLFTSETFIKTFDNFEQSRTKFINQILVQI